MDTANTLTTRPSAALARQLGLLPRLTAAVGQDVAEQAERSLARLERQSRSRSLTASHVLLPFGGGKDCSWTLAYLRLMQLMLLARGEGTFQLHLLIMLSPGTPHGVFANISNVFSALEIDASEDVHVFATSLNGEPVRLAPGSLGEQHREVFRQDILISGHLARGNGRETFCYACNFLVMNAIARYVTAQDGELDFVVTGDSNAEFTGYWKWVQKTASRFGLERIARGRASWASLFGKLAEINDSYYLRLMGPEALTNGSPYVFPHLDRQSFHAPESFQVFVETSYEFWTHDEFMRGFLGFELRPDAFNFTESDCRNPLLMAHLRGLLAEFEGRGYVDGVREYTRFATVIMRQKQYDDSMITRALAPYRDEARILYQREQAEEFARASYGLAPSQLAGMVASPVTDGAARMHDYLRWRFPDEAAALAPVLERYLECFRRALSEEPAASDEELERRAARLWALSLRPEDAARARRFLREELGLATRGLRLLALRRASHPASELGLVRLGDPHQWQIGSEPGRVNNVMTGR